MTKLGRNNECPCGSGQKYKLCCLPAHEAAAAERAAAERATTAAATPHALWGGVQEDWDDEGLDDASNLPMYLLRAGKLDEAETAARDLLARYPQVHDGLERLAAVYDARGDRQKAVEYYRKALAFMQERADEYSPEAIHALREIVEKVERAP
jgi:tetratricopeptide (TPR) repeat protein